MMLLAQRQPHLLASDVEAAIESLLEQLSDSLARGEPIKVRGFGSFSVRYRRPGIGYNLKTGKSIALRGRHLLHFKPGNELCARLNGGADVVRHVLHADAPISDTEDAVQVHSPFAPDA